MKRILILSPGSPCRNPRPVKEADALGRAGYDVTLLTASESPALDAQEKTLTAGAPFRHESVDRAVGSGRNFLRRLRWQLAVKSTAAGFETLHALGHVSSLRARAFALPADLTIVHNELCHWIGCDLLQTGRRVAADFEDWHSEDLLPAERSGRPLARMRALERQLLHTAAYTATTSAALSAALARRYACPAPFVLTNSFPLQPDPRSVPTGEPPAFFWFSQTIGPGRGLEEFCAAWKRTTNPSRLVLLGAERPGYNRHLLSLLPDSFRPRVTFLPLVTNGELPGVIARHDIGLALEQSFIVNRDLTITNKILQYLNAGLAIVATPTAGQREVLAHAPGAGRLIDLGSPAKTAALLDELTGQREDLVTAQRCARAGAESTYCWEREAPRLLDLVERTLASQTA